MRSAILDSTVRPVVIVFPDPTSARCSRFFQAPILRRPDFLFFQAAVEPFDVAFAFRVMIRRPPMGDAEPPQRLQEARRSELRSIVGGQRHVRFTAALGQPCQDCLLYRSQCIVRSATVLEIPAPATSRVQQSITHTRYAQTTGLALPRSSSCPTARSDLARLLPHGPILSSFEPADDGSAPATHERGR